MQLDTRRPVIVLLGEWNPAVFRPQWAATHLYDIQEGSEVNIGILNLQPENKTLTYIQDDIGYYVDNTRFEIYANSFVQERLADVAGLVGNLFRSLPHTPLGDFGVNFHFRVGDPPTTLMDKLKSKDHLESHFRIISQEFTARIALTGNCQLNFKRVASDDEVVFDFNYHHSVQTPKDFSIIVGSYLSDLLAKSKKYIKEIYDVEACEEVGHDFARRKDVEEIHDER